MGLRALCAALLLAAAPVQAHDSWLVDDAGSFALATGDRFPLAESRAGASPRCATPALSCWLALEPRAIELDAVQVARYLAEIQASEQVRDTWAQWRNDGRGWHERYAKFARIEVAGAAQASPPQRLRARRPVGAPLEIVVLGGEAIATGASLDFQVLRDGEPLAGFPVELVSERSRLGIWRRTDALGRVQHTLPFGGRWLLRGTHLRVAAGAPGRWESDFATLAIEAR